MDDSEVSTLPSHSSSSPEISSMRRASTTGSFTPLMYGRAIEGRKLWHVLGPNGSVVARGIESEAMARLFAASPKLLAALKDIAERPSFADARGMLGASVYLSPRDIKSIRAAIEATRIAAGRTERQREKRSSTEKDPS